MLQFVDFLLQSVYRPKAIPSSYIEEAFKKTVADVQYHYSDLRPVEIAHRIQANQNELAVFLFRLGCVLHERAEDSLIPQVHSLLKRFCGCEIYFNNKIDVGFYVVHGEGAVLGSRNRIEKGFKIHQGCTIGHNQNGGGAGSTIGNDVVMYANSSLIGELHVGDRVVIGAHVLFTADLAEDSIVLADAKTRIKERRY